jgi:hypothetical protein
MLKVVASETVPRPPAVPAGETDYYAAGFKDLAAVYGML